MARLPLKAGAHFLQRLPPSRPEIRPVWAYPGFSARHTKLRFTQGQTPGPVPETVIALGSGQGHQHLVNVIGRPLTAAQGEIMRVPRASDHWRRHRD